MWRKIGSAAVPQAPLLFGYDRLTVIILAIRISKMDKKGEILYEFHKCNLAGTYFYR